MNFRLLLWLKLRLLMNAFRAGHVKRPGILAFVLGVLMFGVGLVPALSIAFLIDQHGADGLLLGFAGVQAVWIGAVAFAGALGESVSVRRLLRYPLRAFDIHLFNVLATPIDLSTLLFLPSLLACVITSTLKGGIVVGVGVAVAVIALVAITAATAQLVRAMTERWLRHEWARTIVFAMLALVGTVPSILMRMNGSRAIADRLVQMQGVVAWIPTVALPGLIGTGIFTGRELDEVIGVIGSVALFGVLVWVGGALSGRAAMEPNTSRGVAPRRGPASRVAPGVAAGASAPASPFLTLLGRELRYLVRTPAVLTGALTTPLIVGVFMFTGAYDKMRPASVYLATFWIYLGASALLYNPFGHEAGGVRWFFMLPVDPRRLIVVKNALGIVVFAVETAAVVAVLTALRMPVLGWHGLTALMILLIMIGLCLRVANRRLANYAVPIKPGRRRGGVGTGGLWGMLIVYGVTVAGVLTAMFASFLFPYDERWPARIGLLAIEAAIAWLVWLQGLSGAAARLEADRELLLRSLSSEDAAMS